MNPYQVNTVDITAPAGTFKFVGPVRDPWCLLLTPDGRLRVYTKTRPNAWVRFWQKALLGWRWVSSDLIP